MRTLKKRVSQFMSHCDELIQFSSPSVQRVVSEEIAFFKLKFRVRIGENWGCLPFILPKILEISVRM